MVQDSSLNSSVRERELKIWLDAFFFEEPVDFLYKCAYYMTI